MYDVLLFVGLFGVLTSAVYLGMVLVAAARFRRSASTDRTDSKELPSVTLLKPLHGMEPHLRENLESFFRQDYPHFEIVFGVRDDGDPALAVVHEIAARYPKIPARIVFSGEPIWPNAKVHNLNRMMAEVTTDLLVISDSDVRVDASYIREVTAPLLDPAVGLVTCVYRGLDTGGLWSRLEALGMSVEMTSGVLVANMLEGMKFALGPTMATRRDCLEKIGGMTALSEYLADDYVLGNLIHRAGYEVVLSHHVIDHMVLNRSMPNSLQHQIRWAKSTRRSRPKGHVGTGLTYAVPFALLGGLAALAKGRPMVAAGIVAFGLLNRVVQCLVVGGGVVRDPRAFSWSLMYPVRDMMGFAFWAASFVGGSTTTWRGSRYRIQTGGRMVRETPLGITSSQPVG